MPSATAGWSRTPNTGQYIIGTQVYGRFYLKKGRLLSDSGVVADGEGLAVTMGAGIVSESP
jgi:hypothetical protein